MPAGGCVDVIPSRSVPKSAETTLLRTKTAQRGDRARIFDSIFGPRIFQQKRVARTAYGQHVGDGVAAVTRANDRRYENTARLIA